MIKNVYTPNDFLDKQSDSAMIQAAVDEAAKYGVTVEIPRYNQRTGKCLWELDESIKLHTGSSVILDNCHLRLCDYKYVNFFTNSNAAKFKNYVRKENRQYDISLIGKGHPILDGGVPCEMCEGDFTIYDENGNFVKHVPEIAGITSMAENIGLRFINVERITVSNLRFVNNRYWTMSFWFCSYGTVRDISVEALNNVPNQDGINLRQGVNNFLVENVDAWTGDDTVALTNFGPGGYDGTDLSSDVHDIIVRNIRSRQTGECDMIRILARGGGCIYNVLIDGVFDLTDPHEEKRPLAAIRIGDICDYQKRRNILGETRNLVIRNVVTRGRFGAYIADTLCDSVFDNMKLYADAGIGMYFNGCTLKNVRVRDLCYDITAEAPDSDLGYQENFHRVKIDELNAVHFNNCTAENLVFDGVVTGKKLSHVFGGNSELTVKASHVEIMDSNTTLTNCANIVV